MITSRIEGVTFHHNGDFSGNVAIAVPHTSVQNWPDHAVIEIPFLVLAELVGRKLKSDLMAEIEMESGVEFLGLDDDVDDLPEMQGDDDE